MKIIKLIAIILIGLLMSCEDEENPVPEVNYITKQFDHNYDLVLATKGNSDNIIFVGHSNNNIDLFVYDNKGNTVSYNEYSNNFDSPKHLGLIDNKHVLLSGHDEFLIKINNEGILSEMQKSVSDTKRKFVRNNVFFSILDNFIYVYDYSFDVNYNLSYGVSEFIYNAIPVNSNSSIEFYLNLGTKIIKGSSLGAIEWVVDGFNYHGNLNDLNSPLINYCIDNSVIVIDWKEHITGTRNDSIVAYKLDSETGDIIWEKVLLTEFNLSPEKFITVNTTGILSYIETTNSNSSIENIKTLQFDLNTGEIIEIKDHGKKEYLISTNSEFYTSLEVYDNSKYILTKVSDRSDTLSEFEFYIENIIQ